MYINFFFLHIIVFYYTEIMVYILEGGWVYPDLSCVP